MGKYKLWHTCLRKVGYSRKEAEAKVVLRNIYRGASERPYDAYRCGYCSQYHLGHERK